MIVRSTAQNRQNKKQKKTKQGKAKKEKKKREREKKTKDKSKKTKDKSNSPTMADDDVDHDLLDFMRKAMGLDPPTTRPPLTTKVLESAQFIFDNAIDIALDPDSIKTAAETIYRSMQEKSYSTSTWSEHELHPKEKNEDTVDFILTMDILNFSFWSDFDDQNRFAVNYRGKRWTGYWSLVALLRRALDEGLFPIAIVRGRDKPRDLDIGWNIVFLSPLVHSRYNLVTNIAFMLPILISRYRGFYKLHPVHSLISHPGIPITCPYFWVDPTICSDALLAYVFRSDSEERLPLLQERIDILREVGGVLCEVAPLYLEIPLRLGHADLTEI